MVVLPTAEEGGDDVVKTFKLPKPLSDAIDEIIRAEDTDFSKFTRRALRAYVAEIQNKEGAK